MSLELQGELICSEIFASNSNLFPKTRKILMQFARALAAPYPVACYYSVISQIRAQRLALNKPGVPPIPIESVEALLQAPANVCLIRGLKTNGRRLWGCVAKDPKDVKAFGDGVCLNADMVEALEASSAGSRVERVTALFVCITYAHESMHRIHLRLFPKFHNEDTPPGISGISGAARGESGWKLEQELFGGLVGVWWTPKAEEEGDFTEILRVTVQKGDSQDQQFMLNGRDITTFLEEVGNSRILPLGPVAISFAGDPPLGHVRSRPPPPPPRASVGLGLSLSLTLGSGEVLYTLIGSDKRSTPHED